MSSLNLTAESEITISYVHHLDPKISATGMCSIFIEAPPDKVLSILFLNHTCSNESKVRVEDPQDCWSTALDGCIPWVSPGYDVTTANRSAVMVIDVHKLTSFFMLTVQIKTVAAWMSEGILTRYVSSILGYIQTPSWHPYTRRFTGSTHGIVTVSVPGNHWTLMTVVYCQVCPHFNDKMVVTLTVRRGQRTQGKKYYIERSSYRKMLSTDFTGFRIELGNVPGSFFYGFRSLFSFHQTPSALHQRPGGLWNCSVPSWPDFRQHFACNRKIECSGQDDEMWCPDFPCHQGALFPSGKCSTIIRLPKKKNNTWHHANYACKQQGAALASFSTVIGWYHLALLSQTKWRDEIVYIGLHTAPANSPQMYRYTFQWYNGPISHFVFTELWRFQSNCFYQSNGRVYGRSCADTVPSPTYALCQTLPSPMPQKRTGNGKLRQMSITQTQSFSKTPNSNISRISCPDQHWTHDFLACDAFTACFYALRSSEVNVTTDNILTSVCVNVALLKTLFPCQNGAGSVAYSLVCNHLQDCADNSDEDFCVYQPCSSASQHRCTNGQCLEFRQYCDDIVQCVDESDEIDCVSKELKALNTIARPRPPAVADFDGAGRVIYTPLSAGIENSAEMCPGTHVFCPGDGYCLPVYVRCNGIHDCPGLEDETDCEGYMCPGLYRCRGLRSTCLHPAHLCDGWPQCPQHDDEVFCNLTCPVYCACLGHAFTCTGDFHVELFPLLRYLDASGTGLTTGRLANNLMLVYLSLADCDLAHLDNLTLPNVLSLDLSGNRFSVVTVAELNLMGNLQNLSLSQNPLSALFSGNCSSRCRKHEGILNVDLTGVEIKVLNVPSDLPFPSLLRLNLSGSGVTRLVGDGFRSLTSPRILDLRGCPMTNFPKRVFRELRNLRLLFADNYKLCCAVNLPAGFEADDCMAPFDEISSCDAMLRADVYRICLSVLAILALSGNLGSFSLRITSLAGRGKTSFVVFVTHLCVSDFVMGVYMAVIGLADRMYLGKYLWEESRWRRSAVCQAAGVLALLSSEVSALIICLITLDRFLVIRFPFSRFRFSSFSAQVASFLTWTVGVVLVTLPLTKYRHFYGQTGICVPLPITRNDFDGQRYAFGVMILLNLVVFLCIATGQISIYLSMTSNAMSSIDMTRKSRDLIVARRLITVVVSDFLCWFPLGLLGVLAAHGVPIPGEVNVAMAIFVLPLNSALNPFLYTLNMIQEKRQRAKEVKLLKLLMDCGISYNQNVNKE